MLASFGGQPGAAMAIRCAAAIRQAVRTLGLEIRMGVHTGDGEVVGEAAGGVAVHIGARIMPKAAADELLISSSTDYNNIT